MSDFWPVAWRVLNEVSQPGLQTLSAETASALRTDLDVQRYVFAFKQAPTVRAFHALREGQIFTEPPELERVHDGVRARGWPAMDYLDRCARRHGRAVAEILESLDSDNWWVISDGLGVASKLPLDVRRGPILHLLDLWQRADLKWIQPGQAAAALLALAEVESSDGPLEAALTKVSLILLDDRQNAPDLEEVMSQVTDRLGAQRLDPMLTSVETVLSMPSTRERSTYRYEHDGLRHASRGSSDAFDSLIALWLQMLDQRSREEAATDLLLGRAVRLLAAEPTLLRQMGLVALGAALDSKPRYEGAHQVFNEWMGANGASWLEDHRLTADLLNLLRAHQGVLSVEALADLLELGLTWAGSDEERLHWRAWYLLGALRPSLGPRERLTLRDLEAKHGESSGRIEPSRIGSGWVRERSAIPPEELAQMEPHEVAAATTYVPSIGDDDWFSRGATISGFAQALKAEFLNRPRELVPVAADIAREARDDAVVYHLAWAIREAFASKGTGDEPQSRDHALRFVGELLERVRRNRLGAPSEEASLEQALASVVEQLATWLDGMDGEPILVDCVETLISSTDPPVDAGPSAHDPSIRALNSVRGLAVLAALRLASIRRTAERDYQPILQILDQNIRTEQDLGVLSAYGRFLGSLAIYWDQLLSTHQTRLLPEDPREVDRWSAVFITYIAFNGPHLQVAERLSHEYERAIRDLGSEPRSDYFDEHIGRLIGHLVGLVLATGTGQENSWQGLLEQGLATAPSSAAAEVIHDLAFAVRRDELSPPRQWLLDLAHQYADAAPQGDATDDGALNRAWIELLLATRMPVEKAGGVLAALTARGSIENGQELMEYLSLADRPRSRTGARLLRDAARVGTFHGYVRDPDLLRRLVNQYSKVHPDLAWEIVNDLGRAGGFGFERRARSLARDLGLA